MTRDMTLTSAVLPNRSLAVNGLLALGGAAVISVAAQVSVPMFPVPITLQTLAILTIGMAFGARLAAVTLLVYLSYGLMGLPVFAKGMNGVAFAGPTAGFLVGYVGMAYLAGLMTDRGVRNVFALAAGSLVISALLYIPGVAWAMSADALLGLDTSKWGADSFASIWKWYMSPFLIGDAVKAVIAAMVIGGGWQALRALKR
ncbi:MAG: biotin transporter BioY [Pseudomonadota bacterium]